MDIPLLKPKTTRSSTGSVSMIEPISNFYRPGDHCTLSDHFSENSVPSRTSKDEAKWISCLTFGNAPATDGRALCLGGIAFQPRSVSNV